MTEFSLEAPLASNRSATGSGANAFVGRQPILDRKEQLVAYELLYRESDAATSARFRDGSQASLEVIASLAHDLGAEQLLGGKLGFVNVDDAALHHGAPQLALLDPSRTVLEIAPVAEGHEVLLNRIAEWRGRGYSVAVTIDSQEALRRPELALASYVKIDLTCTPEKDLAGLVHALKRAGKRPFLVAEKVESRAQALRCLELGFDLFQGFYFARPETLSAQRFDPGRSAVVQAIKLMLQNADIIEVDQALKRDVALSVRLLRYMNSAGLGLSAKIDSLKQAIALLGYQRLVRWLTVLLASLGGSHAVEMVLARTAIARGRLLEILAEGRFSLAECDHLFIVGTFSLLPAMVMMPMSEALRDLDLPAPIVDALLHRSGPYAPYLALVEACEDPFLAGVAQGCAQLAIAPKALTLAQLQASQWVAQLDI